MRSGDRVQLVDLIGCEDADRVIVSIADLAALGSSGESAACGCGGVCSEPSAVATPRPLVMVAKPPERVEMDRAGYFVIILDPNRTVIVVEHYAYDNQLLHVVEGTACEDLYRTIIDARWVSLLSHAAYLGKELATADLALRHGFPYVQDAT